MKRFLLRLAGGWWGDPASSRVSPSVPPPASSYAELILAIDTADVIPRESDDDGPRVAVMIHALRNAFIYSREEAERRIRLSYPDLTDAEVKRGVRHLESRVRVAWRPPVNHSRPSWVRDWKDL